MKYFPTLLFSFFLLQSLYAQSYQFQRVIQCQNNDFEIITQEQNYNTNNKQQQNSETYLKSSENNSYDIKEESQNNKNIKINNQQTDSKKIKCKKWVHSYKFKSLSQLRQQQHQSDTINHIVDSLPFQHGSNQRTLQTGTEQPIEVQKSTSRSRSYTSYSSSSSNSQNKAEFFLSMYMNINMQQNALIYQG